MHRLLRLVEVFDRAHRVDGVEARVEKRQRPYVGSGGAQRARRARERRSRLARRRLRDVDAEGAGPVPGRPGEDARVLRFVPQIGLEDAQSVERRQVFGEQALLVGSVVARRCGPAKIGETFADTSPESLIRAGAHRVIHSHGPTAIDNARGSPLPRTASAPLAGTMEWKVSRCEPALSANGPTM